MSEPAKAKEHHSGTCRLYNMRTIIMTTHDRPFQRRVFPGNHLHALVPTTKVKIINCTSININSSSDSSITAW